MKTQLILISILLIASNIFAQKGKYNAAELGTMQEGYIVKPGADTVRGFISIEEPHYMEYSISFRVNSNDDMPTLYRPNDIVSFATKSLGTDVVWISTNFSALEHPPEESWAKNVPWAFLNATVYGPITVYTFYNYIEDAETPKTSKVYMQLPDKNVVDISGMMMGFPKKMSAYVSDYPELSKKISNKEKGYKFLNLNSVASEYNAWYLTEHEDYNFINGKKKTQ